MKLHLTTDFLSNLNHSQAEAVKMIDLPLLVVSGAGSGKTRIITYKIAYLLSKGFLPDRILAVTFSKKAAEEMKSRVFSLVGIQSKWISTFHSFCYKILKEHYFLLDSGLTKEFTVYDNDDAYKLFEKVCDEEEYSYDAKELFNKISFLKQHGIVEPSLFDSYKQYDIYSKYERKLIESNAVNFDNLQIFAYNLLNKFGINSIYRDKFDYILIDEFQDTSPVQYEIIKSIARENNVTVVGDPQQSIYSFRGAQPKNIIYFKQDFNPYEIRVERNYRSSKAILNVANIVTALMSPEWSSFVLRLESFRPDTGFVKIAIHNNEMEEALWILEETKKLLELYSPESIAILVRSRYIKPVIKEVFLRNNVFIYDADEYDFFQRAEIKDVLSYFKFIHNPQDFISFERAIKTPPRKIGKGTIENISKLKKTDYLQASKDFCIATKNMKAKAVESFIETIEFLSSISSPVEALKNLINIVNYDEYLLKTYKDTSQDRYSSLIELSNLLERYDSFQSFFDDTLIYDKPAKDNAIKIMTIHSAKGLEFDAVFIPAVEANIFPDYKSPLDEEARCFYVAVTRAKHQLYLSASNSRYKFGRLTASEPGVFIKYISENLQNIKQNF